MIGPLLPLILGNWRILAGVVVAFVAGWTVNGWRGEAERAALVSSYQSAADDARQKAETQAREWSVKLAAIDHQRTAAISEAQNEINQLRSAVAAGSKRLHVRATCPPAAGLPGAPAAPGVGDGAAPRLAADAEQDYFTLLSQLSRMDEQLRACQEWVK